MFDLAEYHRARSVAQAVELLSQRPEARLVAGGTDVLVKLRAFDPRFRQLVDIHDLEELKIQKMDGRKLILGAGLSFSQVMASPLVQEHLPMLAAACASVAGPQIRNMGTVGGNIANGATSADTAAPMLILEPEMTIEGPEGRRRQSILNFHTGPGRVSLAQNEVLVAFVFDLDRLEDLRTEYYKYAMRAAMDIATIGCAVGLKMNGDRLADLRLALAVAAPTPIRCPAAEAAGRGRPVDDRTIADILAALDGDMRPRDSWRASRAFRVRIIKTLVERMIRAGAEGRA